MRTVRASGALTMNLAARALGQSDGVWQVLAGEFAGTGEVTCEQRQDAGLPLDGFDDEGSDVVGQIFFEGFEG